MGVKIIFGFWFDSLYTQRCWLKYIFYVHKNGREDTQCRPATTRLQTYTIKEFVGVKILARYIFWVRYIIYTAFLVIIHILYAQKWAAGYYSPNPCFLIWQNQKHDGRTYTKTSDDISTNRRNESLTSIVHAPLRSGRRTEQKYVYKWYVFYAQYINPRFGRHTKRR